MLLHGLAHPEGVLRKDDFIIIKANWNPKSQNLQEIANELNIGIDSLVFVDDNPAEREIVNQEFPEVCTPNIGSMPEKYLKILDKSGFFECICLSKEDFEKNEMYKQNIQRSNLEKTFADYNEYLKSLEMKAEIKSFVPMYMQRIAQLTNKSNQFNLTTKRYTQAEIEDVAANNEYITLYGKLSDKFGDNGIVSVVIGHKVNGILNIDLWIMSCRVLKRDMEFAMMDELVRLAQNEKINKIRGFYYPTAKNKMVKDFYNTQGFTKISEDENGNTEWELNTEMYENKNKFIDLGGF